MLVIERDAYPRPWTEQQFLQELQAPYARIALLLVRDEIAGYICYWLAAGEMHVLNVATATAFRRRGVAHRLIEHAFAAAREDGAELAFLEVRVGNAAAISVYRNFGFNDDCIRRSYYSDGEDALLMSCKLQES